MSRRARFEFIALGAVDGDGDTLIGQGLSRLLWVQPMMVTQEDEVCHSVPVTLHPVSALGSLSSVALSSAQVRMSLPLYLIFVTLWS